MAINPKDAELVQKILWPGEKVELTGRERRAGPGGSVTSPTSIILTDKRVIIINREAVGIRKDYEVIPYKSIAGVRLEKGIIASTVFIRVLGYEKDRGLLKDGREEGEIDGLNNRDAKLIADEINRKISGIADSKGSQKDSEDVDSGIGGYIYCSNCGAKDSDTAHFCKNCGAKLN